MIRTLLRVAYCIVGMALLIPGAAATAGDPENALLGALHRCIQDRFGRMEGRFGFTRIITPNRPTYHFTTENLQEIQAVAALDRADLDVVLYLAANNGMVPVKGPVPMSGNPAGAPRAPTLQADGARAVATVAVAERFDFRRDDWQFSARPIRATDARCMICHQDAGLKIGDTPGAVLYGYRPAVVRSTGQS